MYISVSIPILQVRFNLVLGDYANQRELFVNMPEKHITMTSDHLYKPYSPFRVISANFGLRLN